MPSGLDKSIRKLVDPFVNPKPNSLLHNRFVLYFVFFIALSNLFIAAFQQDFLFCIYFILIGFVLTFFNRNMIVVLVIAIAFANILRVSNASAREGLTDQTTEKESKESKEPMKEGQANLDFSEVKTSSDKKTPDTKSTPKKSKSDMVDEVKDDAERLIKVQNQIINGFERIDPYMKQAEELITKIDTTAKQIQDIKEDKVGAYKK